MAIALDKPICFQTEPAIWVTVVRAEPVPAKLLGHHVVVTGDLGLDEDLIITVKHIKEILK
jgi:hypothetical protein